MSRKKVQQLSLREAWRVHRKVDGDHPGHMPGSPEDQAYRKSEEERRGRSWRPWPEAMAKELHADIRADLLAAFTRHRELSAAYFELERSIQRRFDRCCHGRRS